MRCRCTIWPPRKSTAASAGYNANDILQSNLGKSTADVIVKEALPGAQAQLTEAGVVNTQSFKVLQAHVLAKLMQKVVLGNIAVDKAVGDAVSEAKELLSR